MEIRIIYTLFRIVEKHLNLTTPQPRNLQAKLTYIINEKNTEIAINNFIDTKSNIINESKISLQIPKLKKIKP